MTIASLEPLQTET